MKYKVDDKVRIRKFKALERVCTRVDTGWKFPGSERIFSSLMEKYCGEPAIIKEVFNNSYRMDIDRNCFFWDDNMIEGYAFEYGDWIEASDNKRHWEKVIYADYIDGTKYAYIVVMRGTAAEHFKSGETFERESYIYARPIQKKHKIIIDDREIEISKESYDNLLNSLSK